MHLAEKNVILSVNKFTRTLENFSGRAADSSLLCSLASERQGGWGSRATQLIPCAIIWGVTRIVPSRQRWRPSAST